jgi:D-alanine-D-alanine ligase-like ATP-grasp enzyme
MSTLIRAVTLLRSRLLSRSGGIDPATRADFYRTIWEAAARELSAEFRSLAEGFVEVRIGERATRIREHLVMLDSPATVALARSKPLAYALLSAAGLTVPEFRQFDLSTFDSALSFLRSAAGPCVIKPAHESAGGEGVTTNVSSKRALVRAAIHAALYSRTMLIEKQIPGDVYRLLYLDGVLLDAIRREPPSVTGDGRSTVRELIRQENDRRSHRRGAAATRRITITPDCRAALQLAGFSLRSVPPPGMCVRVKTASNETAETDCESVRVGKALVEEGRHAAAVLGIRLAGLDVITRDSSVSLARSGGAIVDVNAAPGLDYHYQTRNPAESVPVAVPILRCLLSQDPCHSARQCVSETVAS